MSWTIYCHTHVESGRRYVGMTARSMERRWAQHIVQSRATKNGRWHFPNAIRKYGKEAFSHEVLEVCHDLEMANLAEERWIELLDTRNPERGFNLAKGGSHTPHPITNPWDRPGYREKQEARVIRTDQLHTPEARAAVKAALNAPESKARRSEAMKESHARPEVRQRISRKLTDEQKEHLRQVRTGSKLSPETREKLAAVQATPEYRERQSASHRGKVTSEETKERIRASSKSGDPEVRAKIAASVSSYWESRRSAP